MMWMQMFYTDRCWKSRVRLTPVGELCRPLRAEIKMTPKKLTFFRGFL
jgi:hypothetical protein